MVYYCVNNLVGRYGMTDEFTFAVIMWCIKGFIDLVT